MQFQMWIHSFPWKLRLRLNEQAPKKPIKLGNSNTRRPVNWNRHSAMVWFCCFLFWRTYRFYRFFFCFVWAPKCMVVFWEFWNSSNRSVYGKSSHEIMLYRLDSWLIKVSIDRYSGFFSEDSSWFLQTWNSADSVGHLTNTGSLFVIFSIEAAADTSAKDAHLTADLECHLGLVPHQVSNASAWPSVFQRAVA